MAQGTYYLGRVVKLGTLTQEMLMDAIADSPVINHGKFAWALTDVVDRRSSELPFIFGKLSKFAQEGQVKVVDTEVKSQVDALAENLLIASSPFVYLPEYSGIAYLHVWNQIHKDTLPKRFSSIVEAAYKNFFVECIIEPVSDYGTFVAKLREMDKFTEISAKVHPPNPLFGRLWASLKDYLENRDASELSLKETSRGENSLDTDIASLMDNLADNPQYIPDNPPDITDAALLMAADGYGTGKVIGNQNGIKRVVRTSETTKNFRAEKEPDPLMLAEQVTSLFQRVSDERDMSH